MDVYRVLDALNDAFVTLDRAWRYTYVNARAAEIARLRPDEMMGRVIWDLVPAVVGTETERACRLAMNGQPSHFEHRDASSGAWYDHRVQPLDDGIVIVSTDVTGKREAERWLRALAAIPEPLMILARDWTITYANETSRVFMQGSADAGKNFWEAMPAFRGTDFEKALREAHEKGVKTTVRNLGPTTQRWFDTVVHPTDEGLILASRDVTEAVLAEQALREADRRKDDFLATLAHELRNPLNPMVMAVELLRAPKVDAATRAKAEGVLERQLRHLVRLVDDLLEVERITRGKLELRREPIDLARAIDAALEAARPVLAARGHELATSFAPEPLPLDADLTRLAQVFANVIGNAAKYTDPGGRIAIETRREGEEAVVRVRDNGIGIAPEQLPVVFEMFSQLEPALERSQGGLGIGLALARGLVELHGGTVEARSDGVGKGTEIVVRLPLAKTVARAAEVAAEQALAKRRILVVDDLTDGAEMVAWMLGTQGHEVRVAHDGEGALARAAEWRPEVVLLDIGLPDLDGYEVARRIRAEPWGREPLLIALTGWGQENDKRLAREAGFDHHLTKPLDETALRALLAASR